MSRSDESTRDPQTPAYQTTRRQFLSFIGAATTVAAVAPGAFADGKDGHDDDHHDHDHGGGRPSRAVARYVYVGTYTAPNTAPGGVVPSTALGIYVFKMDPRDGGLDFVQVVDTPNPSFLAIDPANQFLYSTNELGPGQKALLRRSAAQRRLRESRRLVRPSKPLRKGWRCRNQELSSLG